MKNRIPSLSFSFLAIAIVFASAAGSALFAAPPEYAEAVKLYRAGQYEQSLELIRSVFDANKGSLELRMLAAANYHRRVVFRPVESGMNRCAIRPFREPSRGSSVEPLQVLSDHRSL